MNNNSNYKKLISAKLLGQCLRTGNIVIVLCHGWYQIAVDIILFSDRSVREKREAGIRDRAAIFTKLPGRRWQTRMSYSNWRKLFFPLIQLPYWAFVLLLGNKPFSLVFLCQYLLALRLTYPECMLVSTSGLLHPTFNFGNLFDFFSSEWLYVNLESIFSN